MTQSAGTIAARLGDVLGGPVDEQERRSGGASRETWALELGDLPRGLTAQLDPSEQEGGGADEQLEPAVC